MYRSNDRLRAIDASNDLSDDEPEKPSPEAGRKSGWIDLDRADVEITPRDEWAQMYREAWRLQTEQFWVADMSDIDWDRVHDRYKAILPRVRTRSELSDLIWEMHGELGTSHAYEMGGDFRIPPQYQRGFLGADLTHGWRRATAIASTAFIAVTPGPARAIRRSRSPASTFTRAIRSLQSVANASQKPKARVAYSSTRRIATLPLRLRRARMRNERFSYARSLEAKRRYAQLSRVGRRQS